MAHAGPLGNEPLWHPMGHPVEDDPFLVAQPFVQRACEALECGRQYGGVGPLTAAARRVASELESPNAPDASAPRSNSGRHATDAARARAAAATRFRSAVTRYATSERGTGV